MSNQAKKIREVTDAEFQKVLRENASKRDVKKWVDL